MELLSNGNQAVIPPSYHGYSDKNYEWVGTPLCDVYPDDLPDLPDDLLLWLENKNNEIKSELKKTGHHHVLKPAWGNRCDHESHNLYSSILIAKLMKGESPKKIVDYLVQYDRRNQSKMSYF